MLIYGLYVITEGGELLYSELFQKRDIIKDDFMVSGLLTALKMFASEVVDSEVRAFEVEGLSYHFQSFGIFYVVLVCSSPEEPKKYLHELGLRFMKKFGEKYIIQNKTYSTKLFESFQQDTKEILRDIIDISHSINPTKKLTTTEIFNFPEDMQKIALTMLNLEHADLHEIVREVKMSENSTQRILNQLIENGYLGKKTFNEKIIFFCEV